MNDRPSGRKRMFPASPQMRAHKTMSVIMQTVVFSCSDPTALPTLCGATITYSHQLLYAVNVFRQSEAMAS